MVKEISKGVFECYYCGKQYNNMGLTMACEKSHRIIYVPIVKEDLMALINFIYTKDNKFLNERLLKNITKYSRLNVEEDIDDLSNL